MTQRKPELSVTDSTVCDAHCPRTNSAFSQRTERTVSLSLNSTVNAFGPGRGLRLPGTSFLTATAVSAAAEGRTYALFCILLQVSDPASVNPVLGDCYFVVIPTA